MIKKIDHLGIAVRSLDEAVPYYEKALGLKCEHREEVASQKVRTAFFSVRRGPPRTARAHRPGKPDRQVPGEESRRRHSPRCLRHRQRRQAQLQQAAGAGVRLINEKPFDGAGGKLVAFLHPKSTFGVLTEFCMPKPGVA